MGMKHVWTVSAVDDIGEQLSVDVQAEGPVHALEVFLRDTGLPESAVNQVHILFRSFGKVGKNDKS
jgi:hypothetical protein